MAKQNKSNGEGVGPVGSGGVSGANEPVVPDNSSSNVSAGVNDTRAHRRVTVDGVGADASNSSEVNTNSVNDEGYEEYKRKRFEDEREAENKKSEDERKRLLDEEEAKLSALKDEEAVREANKLGIPEGVTKEILDKRKYLLAALVALLILVLLGIGTIIGLNIASKTIAPAVRDNNTSIVDEDGSSSEDMGIRAPDGEHVQLWKEAYVQGLQDGFTLGQQNSYPYMTYDDSRYYLEGDSSEGSGVDPAAPSEDEIEELFEQNSR